MAAAIQRMAAKLPLPHYARTPSLSSSDGTTSGSSEFDIPLKKDLPSLPSMASYNKAPAKPILPRGRVSYANTIESRRSRTLSSFLPLQTRRSLGSTLKNPKILACLIEHLPWVFFYTLSSTCREFRHILRNHELKDIVLAQYVPGYKTCIEYRDMTRFQDVHTTISHLDLLCELFFFQEFLNYLG